MDTLFDPQLLTITPEKEDMIQLTDVLIKATFNINLKSKGKKEVSNYLLTNKPPIIIEWNFDIKKTKNYILRKRRNTNNV